MAAVVNAPAAGCCTVAARSSAWQQQQLPPLMRARRSSRAPGRLVAVAAVGDVAAEGNTYLIAGAVAVALVGTAFPILFSRKDTCPECDGAGFIRKAGSTLRANAARKDQAQIVCPNCNGLGKLGQIDKQ
ncbi:uncharacterized protein LOC120697196 [Panicum virgatum]|uniref:Uncharacterized protein n=1 Tax=Panicum virgatum TaxID=38727 RepID=A0A8T0USE3_PANVG|nr:uncharacterized protein LOC120697196 [Panicum virgatum]KAG2624076.1 hypothetical protein PVAP13_3KG099300 [Panicum virgatum]